MKIYAWAHKWGIPFEAVTDLMDELGTHPPVLGQSSEAMSEAGVTKLARLAAAKEGGMLWRNNVGAMVDENGRVVRFGLANESKQMNTRVKSSDLVGIKPVIITEDMTGLTIGQFVARECKDPNWTYSGTSREKAQLRFLELIIAKGGDAKFTRGEHE